MKEEEDGRIPKRREDSFSADLEAKEEKVATGGARSGRLVEGEGS